MRNRFPAVLVWLVGALGLSVTAHADVVLPPEVVKSFDVAVIDGPGAGATGVITVTYGVGALAGVDEETLRPEDVDIALTLFSQEFTDPDDIDYPDFPEVGFIDGVVTYIDFIIFDAVTPIDEPGIGSITGGEVVAGVWEVYTTPVPLPAGAWLLASGLGLTGMLLGRRHQPRRS